MPASHDALLAKAQQMVAEQVVAARLRCMRQRVSRERSEAAVLLMRLSEGGVSSGRVSETSCVANK
jgi:hypothetical protein